VRSTLGGSFTPKGRAAPWSSQLVIHIGQMDKGTIYGLLGEHFMLLFTHIRPPTRSLLLFSLDCPRWSRHSFLCFPTNLSSLYTTHFQHTQKLPLSSYPHRFSQVGSFQDMRHSKGISLTLVALLNVVGMARTLPIEAMSASEQPIQPVPKSQQPSPPVPGSEESIKDIAQKMGKVSLYDGGQNVRKDGGHSKNPFDFRKDEKKKLKMESEARVQVAKPGSRSKPKVEDRLQGQSMPRHERHDIISTPESYHAVAKPHDLPSPRRVGPVTSKTDGHSPHDRSKTAALENPTVKVRKALAPVH
jgi:hypothetical protein